MECAVEYTKDILVLPTRLREVRTREAILEWRLEDWEMAYPENKESRLGGNNKMQRYEGMTECGVFVQLPKKTLKIVF